MLVDLNIVHFFNVALLHHELLKFYLCSVLLDFNKVIYSLNTGFISNAPIISSSLNKLILFVPKKKCTTIFIKCKI